MCVGDANEISEGEYISFYCEGAGAVEMEPTEEELEEREARNEERLQRMKRLYEAAKATKVGIIVCCPTCSKMFKKKSYQQAFCSNKGKQNCKDVYWNSVDEDRRLRASIFK